MNTRLGYTLFELEEVGPSRWGLADSWTPGLSWYCKTYSLHHFLHWNTSKNKEMVFESESSCMSKIFLPLLIMIVTGRPVAVDAQQQMPRSVRYPIRQERSTDGVCDVEHQGTRSGSSRRCRETRMLFSSISFVYPSTTFQSWTESVFRWSPHGSFLTTIHAKGIVMWGGEKFARFLLF